ncbi:hypothetical protein ITP53_11695 [Nonomuraea sp. K274]|uniref:Uncharacterized protein n=1 Tax=Nonomuraea cypriaca TaxID=1187855 RepID=A0A931EYE1_9ACTN|nr:hypothetical protein [Nonomuraea cypriaca]MBF8186397.1 hypothetical protein [Nonomuraea cypriaca]
MRPVEIGLPDGRERSPEAGGPPRAIASSTPAEGLRRLGDIPDTPALPDGGGVTEEEV